MDHLVMCSKQIIAPVTKKLIITKIKLLRKTNFSFKMDFIRLDVPLLKNAQNYLVTDIQVV